MLSRIIVAALFFVQCCLSETSASIQDPACDTQVLSIISANFDYAQSTPSDINEHMPLIYKYAFGAAHATEIGVRGVVSSWAFLKAGVDRLSEGMEFTFRASDISKTGAADDLDRLMQRCPLMNYSFVEGDDLVIEQWSTDVLMIDTWHTYRQLASELERWAPYVNQYILLHDTELFGDTDEGVVGHGGKEVDESLFSALQGTSAVGLWPAVEQFIAANPAWSIQERRQNNNGLTVLGKR